MHNDLWSYLQNHTEMPKKLLSLAQKVYREIEPAVQKIEAIRGYNQLRVLDAFRTESIGLYHFTGSTGYGYGDVGRESLESLYARIFGTEAAIVRPQLASGTHAIAATLFGVLRPGDELLYASGQPYDTLHKTIGLTPAPGSLKEFGVTYNEVSLTTESRLDIPNILAAIKPKTKVVAFQRSKGYTWRPSFSVQELGKAIAAVKEVAPQVITFVDNCYGEFVEVNEPSHLGADLTVGSLSKNPGGTLAPFGGYIVGPNELLEQVFSRLTAPGLGPDVGATGEGGLRLFFQGLYMAPHIVAESLVGAVFTARILSCLGLTVAPEPFEERADIIQGIQFPTQEALIGFCQGIQSGSPIDSNVTPIPAPMAGYKDLVIMSAGSFVQGSSAELSADAPLRDPAYLFLQGGSTREQVIYAVLTGILKSGQIGIDF